MLVKIACPFRHKLVKLFQDPLAAESHYQFLLLLFCASAQKSSFFFFFFESVSSNGKGRRKGKEREERELSFDPRPLHTEKIPFTNISYAGAV